MVIFQQINISTTDFFRTFKSDINTSELVWHFDAKDRYVEPQHLTDWQFQYDNELPFIIKEPFFIPKKTYHRLIKGSQDLTILIKEK